MLRIVICTVAMSFLIAATAAASAAPLEIVPGRVLRYSAPPQRYAQYDPGKATLPLARRRPQAAAQLPARAYLLRGFMNIFSLGIDDLAAKIQANGIAAMVANHADAEGFVNHIVTRYEAGDRGPIILIGHSFGADAAIAMAQVLDRYDIPVTLVILFDGTAAHDVPRNVATAINFTQQFDLTPGTEFHSTISNVDLKGDESVDHFTIDKSPLLQARALDYVLQASSLQPSAPAHRP